jgi:glycosyltransferase involved in cell wall biosynthesis
VEHITTTLVILCKNETDGILSVIERARPHVDDLLVIDGHSTDGTFEKLRESQVNVIQDHGKGKGDGIIMSLDHVRSDIIVFMDADGSHEPDDIPKLLEPIKRGEADFVVASRIKGGSDEFYMKVHHFLRLIGGCVVSMATNYRFGVNLTDTGNGFRALKTDVAKSLGLKAIGFDIEQEMVIKALKKKYRIIEVASHEYERQWGSVKLRLYHGWRHIVNLLINIF